MTMTDSESPTPAPVHHDSPVSKYGAPRVMVALVFGVLLLQLGFILSYVAAFHQPTPRDIEIGVVAAEGLPAGTDQQVADRLDAIDGRPLRARVVSEGRQFTVRDEIPVGAHDNRGLSGFYLAVGWVVGGYLLAAAIGLFIGAPRTLRQASVHTAVLFGYAVLSGALGALITTHVLGTFAGHWFPLWLLGTGVVFGTAVFTLGLRASVGILAVPLAIAVFVILGNPSAGGAFGSNVIPAFYAAIGRWITPGAGTESLGVDIGAITKSLVFLLDDDPILLLVSGAHEVDLANTGKRLQGNLTRAPLDMVRIATGQPIGGIAPLGHPTNLPTYVDNALSEYAE
ncbi:YbaK/EbsC family protein, partial [Streptomyces sp. NPDC127092]|uniref:YbaK/EbsC family protein n=1 Tax=Streptomyces sp. NPDC127092 TaxID=3347135 RepID=UPI00365C20F1